MATTATLIIADDHPLLAEGLRSILDEESGLHVGGMVQHGKQLQQYLLTNPPADLILLDLNMPFADGLQLLPFIKKNYPGIKVIIYTSYPQPGLLKQVQQLGANGYLLKTSSSFELKKAIRTVLEGKSWFENSTTDPISEQLPYVQDPFAAVHQITRREMEIIRLIASGHSTKQISEQLFVSEFTVNAHRRNINRKLNIGSLADLINFAREHGLGP